MTGEGLRCPRCGEVMQSKDGYWKCPRCGGEWWPDEAKLACLEEEERARAMEAEIRHQLRWSIGKAFTVVMPLTPCFIIKGSSNKSGRARKKPKPYHPLASERYML